MLNVFGSSGLRFAFDIAVIHSATRICGSDQKPLALAPRHTVTVQSPKQLERGTCSRCSTFVASSLLIRVVDGLPSRYLITE